MMITVKSTQGEQAKDPAERYVLKNAKDKSKAPYAFGLFLFGIGLYLKSAFPGWARPEADDSAQPRDEAGEADPEVAELPESELAPNPDEDLPTGTVGPDGGSAAFSGGALIDLQLPARFRLIETPQIDWVLSEPTNPFRQPVQPYRQTMTAMNDNIPDFTGSGAVPPVTGGPGPDMNEPAGPTTDPTDPTDPECEGPGTGGPCDDDDDNEPVNRAPRVASPVYLYDITACITMVIVLADLLRGASDPDGDALSVTNLVVSRGSLVATEGGWTYLAEPFAYGPVTVSYRVSDGDLSVAQEARFEVLARGRFDGTAGDDALLGTMCGDDMTGGDGDDNIDGRAGNDVIFGGAGNDHIVAGDGDDVVFADAGNDIVFGGRGNDQISGSAGNDRLFGEAGDDIMFGDEGDDFLSGGAGRDLLSGGTGDDTLHGDDGNDTIEGDDGNDVILAGLGDDTVRGGAGNDRIDAGSGNDVVSDGDGRDVVDGGTGNDYLAAAMDATDDCYDGGAGTDTLDYSQASKRLVIDLDEGTAKGSEIGTDQVTGFEVLVSGAGDDRIIGGDAAETIHAGGGDDTISDGDGYDAVFAEGGDDRVTAALDGSDDTFDGGEGCDTLDYSGAEDALTIDLAAQMVSGEEVGDDSFSNFEAILGGAGDDVFILGGQARYSLYGGGGENVFQFADIPFEPEAPVVWEIHDFKAGDRIRMSKYDLFEKVVDKLEDQFEQVYGDDVDGTDAAIRHRIEDVDGRFRTIIEADMNRDDVFETTVHIDGRHVMVMVETA